MKKLLTAIAGLSLLATPLAASAQTHNRTGGGHTTVRPNASRVPGWDQPRGYVGRSGGAYYRGYAPRYYYRDRDYGYALGGLGLGLAAGALLSEPGYGYGYDYGYYSGPCGRWMWDGYRERYVWDAYIC